MYPPDKIIIDRCTVEGNTVGKDSGGTGLSMGGGMRVSNGDITINSTSFLSNTAETHGGGLWLDCEPTCTISNSTFFSNKITDGFGGAIFGDKLRLNNVSIAKNFANGQGGGLFGGSDWVFRNTIFFDNKAGNPWGQAYSCAATGTGDHVLQWVTDLNGAGSDSCISGVIAADPMLADPADNGGPTFTMLPDVRSPALAAGANCEASDQRGQPRNTAACDLGAVEAPQNTTEAGRTYRIPWADLLAKVFEIDVLACPECGGRMRLIAFIAEPTVAKRILDHLDLDSTGPPLAPARVGQPEPVDVAPAYDVADPVYES